jgi:large subunit ribosomal protein L24
MKQTWSKSWNASVQPRKQRKYRYNAPLHIKDTFLSAHLSAELKKKYGKRSVPVITGDKVKIVRGQYKGKEGKVEQVDHKKTLVYVANITVTKSDGSKRPVACDPSNVVITSLQLDDKKRIQKLEGSTQKKAAQSTQKQEESAKKE